MKPDDKRSAGIHVGSASIIMIFAVLCLTVFSTLSYVTANQEYRLAQKSALAMEQTTPLTGSVRYIMNRFMTC